MNCTKYMIKNFFIKSIRNITNKCKNKVTSFFYDESKIIFKYLNFKSHMIDDVGHGDVLPNFFQSSYLLTSLVLRIF